MSFLRSCMSAVTTRSVDLGQHVLAHGQELGDDAGDLAARCERGAGHVSHQAQSAAAVDEADAVLCEGRAERARGLRIGRIGAFARPAVNADAADGIFAPAQHASEGQGALDRDFLALSGILRFKGCYLKC